MQTYKQFEQKLYDENDIPSKEIFARILLNSGYTGIETEEQYAKYDVKSINKEGRIVLWELERRPKKWQFNNIWKGEFRTIHVPERKENNLADFYVGFNSDFSKCYIIPMEIVKSSPLKPVESVGEYFYHVNRKKAKYYTIENYIMTETIPDSLKKFTEEEFDEL